MAVDLSGFAYFAPVFSFLIVFAVVFGVLLKAKILGEHKGGQLFVAFLIATLFISFGSGLDYVKTIVPWMAILIVSLFFLLLVIGFVGKSDWMAKGIGVGVLIVAVLIFIISGLVVFSSVIGPYLPWSSGLGGDPDVLKITDWIYSSRVIGAIILLVAAGLASWVLVKFS